MTLGMGEVILTTLGLMVLRRNVPLPYQVPSDFVMRGVIMASLQPLSQAGCWALASKEKIGFREAFEQMGALQIENHGRGVPLWTGAGARVLSTLSCLYVRDFVAMPIAKKMTGLVFPPHQTSEQIRVFNRPTMLRRLRDGVADLYTWSLALFSAQAITYPLECVRMRLETQFAMFHAIKYDGWLECVRLVYLQEGWKGFYRGFHSWMLQLPAEAVWPLCAWSVGALVVYAVFDDDADDDSEEDAKKIKSKKSV
jgi:hypothetical protein